MDENIGSLISQVARLMRRNFDERVREIGVTRPQWQVLSVLARNAGTNQGGLAELLEVEPITLGRMIDRLQDADLVERQSDPNDRRAWRLYVTPRGTDLLEKLQPYAEAMFVEALDGVEAEAQASLVTTLSRMRINLSRRGG